MQYHEVRPFQILQGFAGSISYGTNTKDSDVDIRGIFIPPKEFWLGLENIEQVEDPKEDSITYSIRKYFNLALNANPNILELLWLRKNHYQWEDITSEMHKLGELLIENRALFLSKKVKHSYTGYAHSQLHRMTKVDNTKALSTKRTAKIAKYGYDTKNAMHLIRLLRTGLEILTDGEIQVFRLDARELLQIKNGEWSLEKVKAEAERYNSLVEEAYMRSNLPHKPNRKKVNNVLMEIVEEALEIYSTRP